MGTPPSTIASFFCLAVSIVEIVFTLAPLSWTHGQEQLGAAQSLRAPQWRRRRLADRARSEGGAVGLSPRGVFFSRCLREVALQKLEL